MAGVSGGGQWTAAGAHKGPFSRLALAQYATLLGMRWLVLSNTLRTLPGVLELSARIGSARLRINGAGTEHRPGLRREHIFRAR
jgi:hypothetical protein